MPKTVNHVVIEGYVGRDAAKRVENGPVNFSIATGNDNKPDGKYPLCFHNIVVWGKPEALGIRKGDFVRAEGRLNYPRWTGKDGVERSGVEIVAFAIVIEPKEKPAAHNTHGVEIDAADIPF